MGGHDFYKFLKTLGILEGCIRETDHPNAVDELGQAIYFTCIIMILILLF